MDYIGVIVRDPDPPGVSNQRWIELIRDHPHLVPPQPVESINPFTKKPMTIRPRHDVARAIVDGKQVGLMSWALDDTNHIDVYGDRQAMVPLAREVAKSLGGRFDEDRAG